MTPNDLPTQILAFEVDGYDIIPHGFGKLQEGAYGRYARHGH